MSQARIPVTILSGFLGSGKTTVLNRLLRDPDMTDTAIIVNEFGEIGLDHLLVESSADQMVLMDNGCLCCSVRGDLADTLTNLMERAAAGEIPTFSRVILETTGLADPAPIAQELLSNPSLANRAKLKAIIATVDSVVGLTTLDTYDEARCQVAMADLVLVTKSDLPNAKPDATVAAVAQLNPEAEIIVVSNGRVSPEVILRAESAAAPKVGKTEDRVHEHDDSHGDSHDHGHDHSGHNHAAHDHAGHDHSGHGHLWNIQSASIVIDTPLPWQVVRDWLEWLTAMRGTDLLRIKGLLAIEGQSGPVLVQAVQHVFSPPVVLRDWPDADHRSRIVLIARDIPEQALRASLERFRAQQAA